MTRRAHIHVRTTPERRAEIVEAAITAGLTLTQAVDALPDLLRGERPDPRAAYQARLLERLRAGGDADDVARYHRSMEAGPCDHRTLPGDTATHMCAGCGAVYRRRKT